MTQYRRDEKTGKMALVVSSTYEYKKGFADGKAEAVAALEAVKATEQAQHERILELQMLAWKWMEAHDCLKAGKPYSFPAVTDLPDALAARALEHDDIANLIEELLAAAPTPDLGPEGFFDDPFDKPLDTDTALQSSAREAGWALSTLVDEIKFEKRQQVVNIINRLSAALVSSAIVPSPALEANQQVIETLRVALEPFANLRLDNIGPTDALKRRLQEWCQQARASLEVKP